MTIKDISKTILRKVGRYKYLILCIVIPLFVVNLFDYSETTVRLSPEHFLRSFQFDLTFSIVGISFYVSLITVITLIFAIVQWMQSEDSNRKATINGLIEELHHNYNMVKYDFIAFEEAAFFKALKAELDRIDDISIYPNPSDGDEVEKRLNGYIQLVDRIPAPPYSNYLALRGDFTSSIINSRTFFNLRNHRLFLNLGHLDFSLRRYRHFLERGTLGTSQHYRIVRNEYLTWVHYRLYFMLIDLIRTIDEDDVIDKKFYREIKGYLEN